MAEDMPPMDLPKGRRVRRRDIGLTEETLSRESTVNERLLTELGMDLDEYLALSEAERAVFMQAVSEFIEHGQSLTAASLVEADYKWPAVSCEQFLDDPYYLGEFTKDMYPACRAALIETFDGDTPPIEVILGGSIGWGKTTLGAAGILYDLYRVSCLRNPHEFYGLMPGAKIAFAIFSTSKEQAAESAFGKMLTWADSSPYFRERMPRVKGHTTRMAFTRSPLLVITGSQEAHSIGKDMYGFLLDEANFLNSKNAVEDQGRAYQIYANAKNRMASRFQQAGGRIPGKCWLISSKRTHASFLENHITASKDDISQGRTRVYEYARWQVLPASKFTLPKFRVEVGDRINPSRILKEAEDPRVGADVITVPGEYRPNFEKDIDGAMRDIAGIASYGMLPLFHDKNVLLDPEVLVDTIPHPFTKDEISTNILDDIDIGAYFKPELLFQVRQSRYFMRIDPLAPRFVHVDIGLTGDAMGIACVHQSGWKVVRRPRIDGTYFDDKAPILTVDFMLRITPPKGSEIDLGKMRGFLINLRDIGLPLWRISFDGYQSRDSMQIMRKMDFDAVLYSVDKTDEAYLSLRQAVVEKRIRYYRYETFLRECFELERNLEKNTVDHPAVSPATGGRGSKDVSDAVAGASYQCLIDPQAAVSPSLLGDPADNMDSAIRTKHGELPWEDLEKELRT